MESAPTAKTPTDPGAPSDEAGEARLVARARGGDRGAFDRLVRGHYGSVYAAAFRLVGNPEDAEDLAQDCFVRAHRALRWLRAEGSVRAWLRRILLHLARDRFRAAARRPRRAPLPLELSERPHRAPAAELGRAELSRLVADAIDALPTHLRFPLVLRSLEGWSYDEIADASGVTPETARTQVMRARRALRRRLRPYLEER